MQRLQASPAPLADLRLPSRKQVRRALLILFGLFLTYSAFYFLFVKPTLPTIDKVADRYMGRVQASDWNGVTTLSMSRGAADLAIADWKRIRETFGPIRSYQAEFNQQVELPTFTRGWRVYKLHCDKGDVECAIALKPRWSVWKVMEAKVFFRPPAPFQSQPGGPSGAM